MRKKHSAFSPHVILPARKSFLCMDAVSVAARFGQLQERLGSDAAEGLNADCSSLERL
jgi:hypothetical protein